VSTIIKILFAFTIAAGCALIIVGASGYLYVDGLAPEVTVSVMLLALLAGSTLHPPKR
jgi:hypothetical protein